MGGKKNFFKGLYPPNTFIGAVGGTSVTSASDLAGKLSLNEWNIRNFQIDADNNVSCYIHDNYSINNYAWSTDSIITYYIDMAGKCTALNIRCFHNAFNPAVRKILVFPNVTTSANRIVSGGGAGTRNSLDVICLPKLEPIGALATTSDSTFNWANFYSNVYVEAANETNNGGGVDKDISGATASNIGTWISYSSNTNAPSGTTGLYTISGTSTSIDLGWSAVTHTNTIDHYLVFANGVYKDKTATTSLNVTGLLPSTSYDFKIMVIDEMGNNSPFTEDYTDTTSP
jgi:hypothetical protein